MKHVLYFLLLITLLAAFGCNSSPRESAPPFTNKDSLERTDDQITGLAEIQPEQKIVSLYALTSGTVTKVYHDMGDTVRKNEVIATLNTDVEEAQLLQAQTKIATQNALIGTSQAQLSSLQTKAANAKETYDRNAELIKSGGVTRQDLDNTRYSSESSEKDVAAQQDVVTQSQAKLKELNADIAYSETIIAQKKIRAPYDGTILSLNIKVGNSVTPTEPLGDFAPAGHLIAVTEIDELYAGRVTTGMKAVIRPQGKTDTLATGTVYMLSPYLSKKTLFSDGATNMEDRRVREVRILLNDGGKVLIGNRVDCIIKTK